jgi:hypothetical protein
MMRNCRCITKEKGNYREHGPPINKSIRKLRLETFHTAFLFIMKLRDPDG